VGKQTPVSGSIQTGEEIETPKADKYGGVRLNISIPPSMYRNLVRASRHTFGGKVDLAQIARMFLYAGILERVPLPERES
jgi:hypothetical protein